MPLAADLRRRPPGTVITTLHQAYLDRLSRWSDIQEYLPLLHDAARSYPQARVLELGSRKGNSTLAFLAGAEESGGHVWSCDIDDVTAGPGRDGPWAGCERWTFIHGDDMHPAVRAKLPAEVDVLFIDTSHEYEHTLGELEAYMPRVAPGGVALFHDTKFLFARPGMSARRHPAPGRAGDRRVLQEDRAEMDAHPGRLRAGDHPAVTPARSWPS